MPRVLNDCGYHSIANFLRTRFPKNLSPHRSDSPISHRFAIFHPTGRKPFRAEINLYTVISQPLTFSFSTFISSQPGAPAGLCCGFGLARPFQAGGLSRRGLRNTGRGQPVAMAPGLPAERHRIPHRRRARASWVKASPTPLPQSAPGR